MLQIIQHQKNGKLSIQDLPEPQLQAGNIIVQNLASLISAGTERTSVETAQASLIGKARSRPDLVKQVISNSKREGITATIRKVKNRLDNYKELGYSSAGIVVESSVPEFKLGDRVACAGDAHHAEFVSIPKHLAVKIPENVGFDEAAFTTLSAIALQGIRQANVRIGESVAVIGLGLIGLISVQILKANGCRVIGLDISANNFALALKLGAERCVHVSRGSAKSVESFTRGYGTDAVIITAGTSSTEPVELACGIARKKSTIVVVGAVPINIPRSPFYEKELLLTIACSYGPGRYDNTYELDGCDYPLAYVRWTENRNMEAVLDLISRGALNVKSLITHRYPLENGLRAYELITGKKQSPYVGILIEYPRAIAAKDINKFARRPTLHLVTDTSAPSPRPAIGFIGAGNFAQSYLLPSLLKLKVELCGVAVSTPIKAQTVAAKFGFRYFATDAGEILNDKQTNTVFIASRHDSHARIAIESLKHQKHVFVEKPLAITLNELEELVQTYQECLGWTRAFMVGFNRRFSLPFMDIRQFFSESETPLIITYHVNAGELPSNHWIYGAKQGGRIVGEACHFIDTMSFLTGESPIRLYAEAPAPATTLPGARDTVSVTIRFAKGSIGQLLYSTVGDPSMGKEFCAISGGGMSATMDNFKEVVLWRGGKKHRVKYRGTKGHAEEVNHFIDIVSTKAKPLLSFQSIYETSKATLAISESLQKGVPIDL